jgi:hypothetical protein
VYYYASLQWLLYLPADALPRRHSRHHCWDRLLCLAHTSAHNIWQCLCSAASIPCLGSWMLLSLKQHNGFIRLSQLLKDAGHFCVTLAASVWPAAPAQLCLCNLAWPTAAC